MVKSLFCIERLKSLTELNFTPSGSLFQIQGGPKKLHTAFFAITLPTLSHFSYFIAHIHYRKFATG